VDVINVGYEYDPAQSVTTVTFAVE